jgi:hypothetical protein|tara:strand:+ start:178 stop:432 length:255 start_codon:yes stop_codon:yes gene_type:complete
MEYIGKQVMTQPIIGDITYTHNQSSTSDTWVITHNLHRFPSVTVVDSADTIVQGTVVYNSNKQLTITFFSGSSALAFQGKAYLN